jgi:hypothetical protein
MREHRGRATLPGRRFVEDARALIGFVSLARSAASLAQPLAFEPKRKRQPSPTPEP